MNSIEFLNSIKKTGRKITPTRKTVVKFFDIIKRPLSELELRKKLSKSGIRVNKTTVYRELDFLKKRGFIREVEFGDGKTRFEINSHHHYHLVCLNCDQVDEVTLLDIERQMERKVRKQKRFHVTHHLLEFFGLCRICEEKIT